MWWGIGSNMSTRRGARGKAKGGWRGALLVLFAGLAGCDPSSSGTRPPADKMFGNDAAGVTPGVDGGDAMVADDAAGDDSALGEVSLDASSPTDVAVADALVRPTNPTDGAINNCGIDGAACGDPGGTGLCKGDVCSACVDQVDDALCASAFGSSSAPYICLAGVCTPGDCRGDADCANSPNGPLCGVASPHTCGKCSSDAQCAANAATPICDTTKGRCVGGTCVPASTGAPSACPVNPADVCCGGVCQPLSGSTACCPGTAGTAYCQGLAGAGADCINGICTVCVAPSNGQYFVDSVGGSDLTGSGANSPGCAFGTITRALQVIGQQQAVINVKGGSTLGPGETFPIVVPPGVSIFSEGGLVTVQVPAGHAGFLLRSANSLLGGPIVIDGQSAGATYGIVVGTGSNNNTLVDTVTVRGFAYDGILVEDTGMLTMRPPIQASLNGLATGRHAGLRVRGSARALLNAGGATINQDCAFDRNGVGIAVEGGGSVSLTGTPILDSSLAYGTLVVGGNASDGLRIEPGQGSPPASDVTGLVAYANQASGIHLVAGANVIVRGSVTSANGGSGVLVSSVLGTGPDDIHLIDLGTVAGSAGNNDVEEPPGVASNGAAGLCLAVRPDSGTLAAAGNTFASPPSLDAGTTWARSLCAAEGGVLTLNVGGCGNDAPTCLGGVCDVGILSSGNQVDLSNCSSP
jgi:hypothetical protein